MSVMIKTHKGDFKNDHIQRDFNLSQVDDDGRLKAGESAQKHADLFQNFPDD